MNMSNDALRALRAPIEDRIDLRHRILDAVVDRGGKLRAPEMLATMINRIDDLVWVDGDMRVTRLRYEIFNTCLRKDVNLGEKTPSEDPEPKSDDTQMDLLNNLTAMLTDRGAGIGDGLGDDFGGHPDFVDPEIAGRPVGLGDVMARLVEQNDMLMKLLEKLANPPMIISEAHGAQILAAAKLAPGSVVPIDPKSGMPLTGAADGAKEKRPPLPGTPGGKGKKKP